MDWAGRLKSSGFRRPNEKVHWLNKGMPKSATEEEERCCGDVFFMLQAEAKLRDEVQSYHVKHKSRREKQSA
ncbi:hypothetical protein RUM44_002265 [Polyplax serrata]|uniref:Uncharacterized protein n=1 Tax=Polyplax serrata TaxID=468196 RepID=A0ABR1AMF4_POLSC